MRRRTVSVVLWVLLALGVAPSPHAQAALPAGVPVETIVDAGSPRVTVDGTTYAMGAGQVQVVVLDRATLAPSADVADANQTFALDDPFGVAELVVFVEELGSDNLVIVSGGNRPGPVLMGETSDQLVRALAGLGSAGVDADAVESGEWSLVGVPGLDPGEAYELWGGQQSLAQPPGDMRGVFKPDVHGNFAFDWPPTYDTFDTSAPGSSSTQNVVAVNGDVYRSGTLPPGASGWQLVWLDSGTLRLRGNYTFMDDPAPSGLVDRIGTIQGLGGDAPLLILTSIGKPAAASDPDVEPGAWPNLAQTLADFGANPYVVLGLDGSGGYSLVGLEGLGDRGPNGGTELSQGRMGTSSARIAGTFRRNRQGQWTPASTGSPEPGAEATPFQSDIQQLLAAPPQPFEPFAAGGPADAEAYISAQLGFGSPDPTYGIRALYWTDDSIDWSDRATALATMNPCVAAPCVASFAAVRTQLLTEFEAVDTVRQYFTGGGQFDLAGIVDGVIGDASVGFAGVYADIQAYYDDLDGTATGPDVLSIISSIAWVASAMPGLEEADVAALDLTSSSTGLLDSVLTGLDGSPAFDPAEFSADAGQFATELEDTWTDALDNLDMVADLLVSDAGRLAVAADKVDRPISQVSPRTGRGWGFATATKSIVAAKLTRSVAGYMWQSLLPVAAQVYLCMPPAGWGPEFGYADEPIPGFDRWAVNVPGSQPDGSLMRGGLLTLSTYGSGQTWNAHYSYPGNDLVTRLFGRWSAASPSSSLGLQPYYFLAPSSGGSPGFDTEPGFVSDDGGTGYWCAGSQWPQPAGSSPPGPQPPAATPSAPTPAPSAPRPPAGASKPPRPRLAVGAIGLARALRAGLPVRVTGFPRDTVVRARIDRRTARRRGFAAAVGFPVAHGRKRTTRATETVRLRFTRAAVRRLRDARAVKLTLTVDGHPLRHVVTLRNRR